MSSPALDHAGPLHAGRPPVAYHSNGLSTSSTSSPSQTSNGAHLDTSTNRDADPSLPPPKKKQKRNKPTLSCAECVERKTKCDRSRPRCISCLKRQTECRYSARADLIYSVSTSSTKIKSRRDSDGSKNGISNLPLPPHTPRPRHDSISEAPASSAFLLSHIPYSKPSPSDVFGIGKEHPFANYWTCQGGLPEVIGILPKKDQADILVAKYFECVDPVYPLLNQQSFYQDYEEFWQLQIQDKYKADPAHIALQLVIYAMGTQFFPKSCATADDSQQAQMAEFYVSAAHQALRIFAYLSRVNLSSIQAMILICYFLMNDNKASDAWAFAGVLIRQAYALGLNRCPDIIVPDATQEEKQQRLKVWQAVFVQDTFLTILLSLPPTSNFSDCSVDALTEDVEPAAIALHALSEDAAPSLNGLPNARSLMSISNVCGSGVNSPSTLAGANSFHSPHNILHPLNTLSGPTSPASVSTAQSQTIVSPRGDILYTRTMWHLAALVQRTICYPKALSQPVTTTPASKRELVAKYQKLYREFPQILTETQPGWTAQLVHNGEYRTARQSLFLRSNYWHSLMLILADEGTPVRPPGRSCTAGAARQGRSGSVASTNSTASNPNGRHDSAVSHIPTIDARAAVDAARTAIATFFDLWQWFETEAGVWWVFQHRAYEEALMICRLLAAYGTQFPPIALSLSEAPNQPPTSTGAPPFSMPAPAGPRTLPYPHPSTPPYPPTTSAGASSYVGSPPAPPFSPPLPQPSVAYPAPPSRSHDPSQLQPDPLFTAAKADVARMLEILELVGTSAPELQKTRREILCRAYTAVGDGV